MLNKNVYEEKVTELKNSFFTDQNSFYKSDLFGPYMLISRGITTFLPRIDNSSHFKIAQDILFHQSLSYVDQFYPKLLEKYEVNDEQDILANCSCEGNIFVTYHTGSYRLFLHHLVTKDISFCLVVQQKYIDDYGDVTQKLFKEMSNDSSLNLEVISSDEPRLLFHLKNKIKNGMSVVFYIDGNTGVSVKENNENSNLVKVDFLNHHIYARQGIAFLAYIAKAPIITAICKRTDEQSSILKINRINTDGEYENREEFVSGITTILYKELENFVKNHPEQWEGWLYIDKFHDGISEEVNASLDKDVISIYIDDFAELYHYDSKYFLALKKELKILEIDEKKYQLIEHFKKGLNLAPDSSIKVKDVEYSWNIIHNLVGMNILKIA